MFLSVDSVAKQTQQISKSWMWYIIWYLTNDSSMLVEQQSFHNVDEPKPDDMKNKASGCIIAQWTRYQHMHKCLESMTSHRSSFHQRMFHFLIKCTITLATQWYWLNSYTDMSWHLFVYNSSFIGDKVQGVDGGGWRFLLGHICRIWSMALLSMKGNYYMYTNSLWMGEWRFIDVRRHGACSYWLSPSVLLMWMIFEIKQIQM